MSSLTAEDVDPERMAQELATIRDQLHRLGESNAEVGRWIDEKLG